MRYATHPRSIGPADDPVVEIDRDVQATMARLDRLSSILDSAVRLPGTDQRIGLDALIGLVPVLGDLITKVISGYLILEARRLGASRWTLTRMAANTTIDAVVGAIPLVGDVFDVMYRANQKNIAILKTHVERHGAAARHRRSATLIEAVANGPNFDRRA